MMKRILSIILFVLLGVPPVYSATTYTAADCTHEAVQHEITDHAVTGDTVVVPSTGSCTWDTTVTITGKDIILTGQGTLATIIHAPGSAISVSDTASRITNLSFVQDVPGDSVIVISGRGWRIDHNQFNGSAVSNDNAAAIFTYSSTPPGTPSSPAGVIDANNFVHCKILNMGGYTPFTNQYTIWSEALTLGSTNTATVYIENNTFHQTGGTSVDSSYSGHFVLRYNTFTDQNTNPVTNHGRSTSRGNRKFEIYNNLFANPTLSAGLIIDLHGGTGVIFNNAATGTWNNNVIGIDNPESANTGCVGNRVMDGNTAITAALYGDVGTGTHSAADGATLTDSTKAWTVNGLIGITVWNLSDNPANCIITANTANTVTCTLSGGTRDHWHTNDSYKITDGYPCRDQIGRGSDQTLDTGDHSPVQDLAPAYAWNNKNGVDDIVFSVDSSEAPYSAKHIIENRDFYNGGVSGTYPGPFTHVGGLNYTVYTCPHPLAGLTGSCSSTVAGIAGYNVGGATTPTLGGGSSLSGGASVR